MRKKFLTTLRSSALYLCLLGLFFISAASEANEPDLKVQLEAIAVDFVDAISMEQSVVLRTISPEESGLPEALLRKVTADFEAALLVASGFEIELQNRFTTEEIWTEAVEFSQVDFDTLYAAAEADVLVLLNARAVSAGLEVSVTAYSLAEDEIGQIIASTGSLLLALDLEEIAGVEVNNLNDQVAQILAEIERIGETGGLIASPNTYAEYYHNARMLQQRGEIDLAIENLEEALALSPFPFLDPIEDLINLSIARYGQAASVYFEQKVRPRIDDRLARYAEWLLDPDLSLVTAEELANPEGAFAPLVALWLSQNIKRLEETIRLADAEGATAYRELFEFLEAGRLVLRELRSGGIQQFYIDKSRARETVDLGVLRNLISEFERVEYTFFETDYEYGTGGLYVDYTSCMHEPLSDNCRNASRDDSYGLGILAGQTSGVGVPGYVGVGASRTFFDEDVEILRGLIREDMPNLSAVDFSTVFPEGAEKNYRNYEEVDGEWVPRNEFRIGPCGLEINTNLDLMGSRTSQSVAPLLLDADTTFLNDEAYGVFPITGSMDRLVFGDICVELARQLPALGTDYGDGLPLVGRNGLTMWGNITRADLSAVDFENRDTFREFSGMDLSSIIARLHGVSGLLVTDNVDTDRPVVVNFSVWAYVGGGASKELFVGVDVTRDGSYLSPFGMPFDVVTQSFPDSFSSYVVLPNGWLFVPGVVQGLVGFRQPQITSVSYFDVFGVQRTVANTYVGTGSLRGFFDKVSGRGAYAPYAKLGAFVRPECSVEDVWTSEDDEACSELLYPLMGDTSHIVDNGICMSNSCVQGISVEQVSSYSAVRYSLFHTEEAIQKLLQSEELDDVSSSVEEPREMAWFLHQEYPGLFRLGDEFIDGWPTVQGTCVEIALGDVPAGGKAGLTYEPFGVESLFLLLPDGMRFDLPVQERRGSSRPNYWGEEVSFALNTDTGAAPTNAHICAGNLNVGDIDDLMIRNIRTWVYR